MFADCNYSFKFHLSILQITPLVCFVSGQRVQTKIIATDYYLLKLKWSFIFRGWIVLGVLFVEKSGLTWKFFAAYKWKVWVQPVRDCPISLITFILWPFAWLKKVYVKWSLIRQNDGQESDKIRLTDPKLRRFTFKLKNLLPRCSIISNTFAQKTISIQHVPGIKMRKIIENWVALRATSVNNK